ncbi:invasion associated locus B family protein [Halovulum dunhuangense]|uniref:Invasion associated locus B family protein n=1 Tax=Halovulum dunhuangense TaxID=1505036 RepID=A0A849L2R5_9RHOB|nr:invasion associated locus B family protein [Halovulum dunhuangense]NNU80553.1 invasion associated locus B family protein [Halovulum dunhuangense]
MHSRSLAIAALMMGSILAGHALAQDAAPTTEPAPEAAPETTVDAPAPAEPAPTAGSEAQPELTITEFGDWELRCEETSDNCFMYQLAVDNEQNPVSEMTIVALPQEAEAAAGVTVITPLGTLLTEGLILQIDEREARQYPFNWCTRSGCFSRFGLTDEEVAAMKAGATVRARLLSVSAPDQPVILELSLTGFTAAFDAMNAN